MSETSEERCAFPECRVESYPGGHRAHDRDCYGLNLGLSGPGCHALVSFRSAAESIANGVGKPSTLGSDAPSAEPLPADNKAAETRECEGCEQFKGIGVHSPVEHLAYEARLRAEIERRREDAILLDEFPIITYEDRSDYHIIGWIRRWQLRQKARRALSGGTK